MEVSILGNIRTPFGNVGLIPQDRNLLQVSSVEPLRFGDSRIHLWAMLERIHEIWGISGVIEPVLQVTDGCGRASSVANGSIAAEVMKTVTLLSGAWAVAHPEAFERAAAEAFNFDKEALYRELGVLREALTCSAQTIESITSEAKSNDSTRLREYSQKMRSMAFEVPAMRKIAQTISCHDEELSQLMDLPHSAPSSATAVNIKTRHLRDVTGCRNDSKESVSAGTSISRQSPSINQPTLGQVLKKQRDDLGLSQQELAFRLGLKPAHVAQLETDRRERPSFQLLRRVAEVLGLDKDSLFQLAEKRKPPSSATRKAVSHPRDKAQVLGAFARNRALLDRHNVKPRELKALSQISLMGKVTGSDGLLFILDAIRKAGKTEK